MLTVSVTPHVAPKPNNNNNKEELNSKPQQDLKHNTTISTKSTLRKTTKAKTEDGRELPTKARPGLVQFACKSQSCTDPDLVLASTTSTQHQTTPQPCQTNRKFFSANTTTLSNQQKIHPCKHYNLVKPTENSLLQTLQPCQTNIKFFSANTTTLSNQQNSSLPIPQPCQTNRKLFTANTTTLSNQQNSSASTTTLSNQHKILHGKHHNLSNQQKISRQTPQHCQTNRKFFTANTLSNQQKILHCKQGSLVTLIVNSSLQFC